MRKLLALIALVTILVIWIFTMYCGIMINYGR